MAIPAETEKNIFMLRLMEWKDQRGVCVSFRTRHDGSACVCILQLEFMGNSHDMINYIYEIR